MTRNESSSVDFLSAESEPTTDSKSVLVIENTPEMFEFIARALQAKGHRVYVSLSTREAIPLILDSTFDWIAIEYSMIEGSPQTFSAMARIERPQTRILLMSSHPDIQQKAARYGMSASLRKPFEAADLERIVSAP